MEVVTFEIIIYQYINVTSAYFVSWNSSTYTENVLYSVNNYNLVHVTTLIVIFFLFRFVALCY